MDKYYVYAHFKLDTGEIFYIGKGKKNRYLSTCGRNKYWKDIVKKHGFRSEILIQNLSEPDAYIQEILGIMELKPAANFTKGGSGGFTGPNKGNWTKGHRPWNYGKKCPEISKRQKGRKTGKPHVRRRPIICITDNKKFDFIAAAAEYYKIPRSSIIHALNGKCDTAYGKMFIYQDSKLNDEAKARREKRKFLNSSKKIKIVCIETGEIFESLDDCATKLNLHKPNLCKVLNGERKKTGGLTFRKHETTTLELLGL